MSLTPGDRMEVSVRVGWYDVELVGEVPSTLPCPAEDAPLLSEAPVPAEWPSWWKPFTDTEIRVLRVASLDNWQSASRLAETAGVPEDRDFGAMLRALTEKGMLESAPGRGFRLKTPPPRQQLPDFCGAGLPPTS